MAIIVLLKILAGIRLRHIGELLFHNITPIVCRYIKVAFLERMFTQITVSLKYILRSQTLSKEFEAYLAKHGLEPEEGVKFVDSSFEEVNSSITEEQEQGNNVLDASYSEEVRRLLRGESADLMSTSMKVSQPLKNKNSC